MASSRFPIPQGTLDMLVLQILLLEPAQVVQSQLYEVTPTDPTTIAAATALLGGASLAAALIPACRAAAVNPTDALRCE